MAKDIMYLVRDYGYRGAEGDAIVVDRIDEEADIVYGSPKDKSNLKDFQKDEVFEYQLDHLRNVNPYGEGKGDLSKFTAEVKKSVMPYSELPDELIDYIQDGWSEGKKPQEVADEIMFDNDFDKYFAKGGIMADGRIVLRTFQGVGGNENKNYTLIKDDRDSDGKPYYTLVEDSSGSVLAQGDSFEEVNSYANMMSGRFAEGGKLYTYEAESGQVDRWAKILGDDYDSWMNDATNRMKHKGQRNGKSWYSITTTTGKTREGLWGEVFDFYFTERMEEEGIKENADVEAEGGKLYTYEVRWFDDDEIPYEDDGYVMETFTSSNPNLSGVSWEDREITDGIVKGNKRYNMYHKETLRHLEDGEYVFSKNTYAKGGEVDEWGETLITLLPYFYDKNKPIKERAYAKIRVRNSHPNYRYVVGIAKSLEEGKQKMKKLTEQYGQNALELRPSKYFELEPISYSKGGMVKKNDFTMLGAGLLIGGLFAFLKK